jgi:hypothetical protein
MKPDSSLPYSQAPPPVPILSQLHLVHKTPSHFLKIYLIIIIPPNAFVSPAVSFPLVSPPTPRAHHSLPPYVPHVYIKSIIFCMRLKRTKKLGSCCSNCKEKENTSNRNINFGFPSNVKCIRLR